MDFLKSAVAAVNNVKGPPFPYIFGDQVTLDQSIWKLFNGVKRENKSDCSIFTFDVLENKSRLPLARNAVRKLRTLRHPGVIKVLDTVETETYIYVATERLISLQWPVRRKALSEETLKWGLFTIANTLAFVNEEAQSVHGSVRTSSIFISQSGEWRLGGLDVLCSMKEDDAIIYTYGSLVPDSGRYAPPEVAKSGWETIKRHPVSAVDSYNLGILVFEVFNGGSVNSDQIGQTKNVPPSMHQSYKRLLNANPKARLSVAHFRDQGRRSGGFFETPLIKLSEGLEHLGLKSDNERDEFLSELDEVSDDFPEEYFSAKVLPELLKSVEFGGGGPRVLSSVVKIASKLSDEQFDARVTPVIVRLFSNPDRAIRVCLLDNLPTMIDHLSQKVVNDKIFPQLVTGFSDVAPVVREQTVKAVLTVVSKLSDRTINGELLKHLAKTANDEQPGIRTNTTICLGKLARSLGANTRQKVITAAFTRSLRDPFVHARNAALLALAATSDLFNDEDCATKILPSLCPSLIDKEKLVRDQATRCFDVYVQRTRKYANTLPDSVLPPPATTNGDPPRMSTPQNDTGWAGWAISSFTNKIGTASGAMETKPASAPRSQSADGRASPTATPLEPSRSSASVSNLHRQAVGAAVPPPMVRTTTDQFLNTVQDADDEVDEAWGEMEDEPFVDASSEPKTSFEPRPAPTPPPISYDDRGEPDFEGWLSAQAKAKSKAPLPKGLAKSTKPASAVTNGRTPVTRTTTTGGVGSGVGVTKVASTAAKPSVTKPAVIDTKPKDETGDDDWGDAWN